MPVIKKGNKEDAKRLNDEYMAHEENRHFDLRRSIRNRTMTKASYYRVHCSLRKFLWDLKNNRFFADTYAF
jgi:hypothetical protein